MMTDAQRATLKNLCERYHVEFNEDDYKPAFDLPPDYVCGWVGGPAHAGRLNDHGQRMAGGTLFVGVDAEGKSSS